MTNITLKLTPVEAHVLFNTIDGAMDAGACEDGNTPQEQTALAEMMDKLLAQHAKWKAVRLDEG